MKKGTDFEDYYLNYGVLESMVLLDKKPFHKTCIPRSSEDDEARVEAIRASLRRIKRKERNYRRDKRHCEGAPE